MLSQTPEAKAMRRLRLRRFKQGICQRCGKVPAREGKILCQDCAVQMREYKYPYDPKKERIRRIKKLVEERCGNCGKPLERKGAFYCNTCLEKANKRTRDLKKRRKEQGLCVRCGKKLPEDYTYRNCPPCLSKERAEKARRRTNLLRQGLCQRCGKRPHEENKKHCQTCSEKKR